MEDFDIVKLDALPFAEGKLHQPFVKIGFELMALGDRQGGIARPLQGARIDDIRGGDTMKVVAQTARLFTADIGKHRVGGAVPDLVDIGAGLPVANHQ